ncbi:MAG: cobalamin biosynthesis protein [Xanthomonadaceae bacterium]|jgi:AmpE protein|nr:cobalamin biosynthesis protein [Xanthomonadaceae bacterium]
MAIKLLAMVIALAVAHTLPDLARLRQFHWLAGWAGALTGLFGGQAWFAGGLGAALVVGLPALAMFGLQQALADAVFGLASLALAVATLFYCWGPRDLDLDVDAVAHAPDAERRRAALSLLGPGDAAPRIDGTLLVDAVFQSALTRWFGVLLWFVVLGPAGALLYRMADLVGRRPGFAETTPPAITAASAQLARLLEWPAAHLVTLALAIAADFDAVAAAWRDWHAARRESGGAGLDPGFLRAAARASVDADIDVGEDYVDDARGPIAEMQEAMALAWRVLVVWGVVLALFVLAGRIG